MLDMPASAASPQLAFEGKTVLVADDDPVIREYLSARCKEAGLRVETATDGLRALLQASKLEPDLLILDLHLPDVEGFRVCERLTDAKFQPLPVVILTADSGEATKQRCKELGATYVQKGGQLWDELEPIMQRIFAAADVSDAQIDKKAEAARPNVLLVDDDAIVLKELTSRLQKSGLDVVTASSGIQGFWLALKIKPDAIVTDYYMAGGDGHYLLSRIKSTPATKGIPVIVCTGKITDARDRAPVERELLGRGQAADFLTKPVSVEQLLNSLRRHAGIAV
ncbi:hypothetical protein AUC71_02910 [Methyloceanibacter marginalis]|uniref:Response regulatory domain-containing protein n=1 Tax=Methyloceanibacter marginalis TaxID=1774971 RepID=A0A1E3W7V2_9HYPH|nr:response regulator [Methyloceanibacter marginalis]ODS01861.1 hypothetical protein AUC71_02910 [Methyloceanibacter marginalis]